MELKMKVMQKRDTLSATNVDTPTRILHNLGF